MFTKGPWKVTGGHRLNDNAYHINNVGVCADEVQANAKLIAAAPDLLAACQELQAALSEYHLFDVKKRFSLSVANATAGKAIAKATN